MRPLDGFWRVVTTLGGMGHALAGWRHLIGEEPDLVRPFLIATPETAFVFPCAAKCSTGNGRTIIENGPDEFVAVCRDDRCDDVQLRAADVVRFQSDVVAVAKALLAPLGLVPRPVEGTPAIRWWRVGAYLTQHGLDVPVVLSTSVMTRELRAGADRLLSSGLAPFIVLVARPDALDLETSAILKQARCPVIALQNVIGVDDAGQLCALRPITGALEAAFGGALALPAAPPIRTEPAKASKAAELRNAFRRDGDTWLVTFEGRSVRLTDNKGLRYLAHLLSAGAQRFHAAQLHAAVAGVERSPALGSAGDVIDEEAKAQYREMLQEVTEELADAKKRGNVEAVEELEERRRALVSEIARATGLGGRSRKASSDAEKLRVSITMAISREIKRIGTHHESLARHLTECVETGSFFSYRSDCPQSWAA